MIVIAFVLVLLLAIWLAVRLGGVRKREPSADRPVRPRWSEAASAVDHGVGIESRADLPTGGTQPGIEDIKAGGGRFGGGGASGEWGHAVDSGDSTGDGGGGD